MRNILSLFKKTTHTVSRGGCYPHVPFHEIFVMQAQKLRDAQARARAEVLHRLYYSDQPKGDGCPWRAERKISPESDVWVPEKIRRLLGWRVDY